MWPTHRRLKTIRSHPFARFRRLSKAGDLWMQIRLSGARCEVNHPTYYNKLSKVQTRAPLAITVFDMIHEIYPEGTDLLNVSQNKRECVKQANVVLCISESTKRDLIRMIPEAEGKCCVTPLAVSNNFNGVGDGKINAKCREYFLYVGGRAGYKRFADLVECWESGARQFQKVRLKVVGSAFTDEERRLLHSSGIINHIEHEGQVADEELAKLYAGCLGLIYTSEYEGFGLPLLEAMQNGAPVVCCNTSSLPEVGGNAPLYFDPGDLRSLRECMRVLRECAEVRESCIARGYKQVARFSWERTTQVTVDAYRWAVDDYRRYENKD